MAEQAWYKDWFNSSFYHKLYFERDEKEAEAFIKKLIEHLKPLPGSRMLDVACGKGRHSKTLASLGFNVTGIDISVDSISYAKQFENDNLEFFVHDMRLPAWGSYFDYAFNFLPVLVILNPEEHDDAIRTIARSLKPGGLFVIDYLNIHYDENHIVHSEEKAVNGTSYRILRWHDESHFFKKIVVDDPSITQPLVYTEKVAKFTLGDFTDMLAFQDMQVQEVFGDYQFHKYHVKETPRLIIIARKKNIKGSR
ncbi:MAG: class I SAM-dependent methyltransferase [Chitinophagaceae bacterium]|nr:class I SAM-dependent methyltransferase [Chitinophagaceae bacterium]